MHIMLIIVFVTECKELLMDVRDKLLFETEYAGDVREKIPPRSRLRIPWAWLPGALCLLQEVCYCLFCVLKSGMNCCPISSSHKEQCISLISGFVFLHCLMD